MGQTCPTGTQLSSQGSSSLTCPHLCSSCSTSKLVRDGLCISCDPGYYLNISRPDHNQCTDCTRQLHLDSWSSVCVPCCNDDYQGAAPCCICSSTPARRMDQIMRVSKAIVTTAP